MLESSSARSGGRSQKVNLEAGGGGRQGGWKDELFIDSFCALRNLWIVSLQLTAMSRPRTGELASERIIRVALSRVESGRTAETILRRGRGRRTRSGDDEYCRCVGRATTIR